jgi:heptaprenyl diphosphate synthase
MIHHSFLRPSYLKIAEEILAWTEDRMETEHPALPGSGKSTCPFVGPSKQDDCFYFAFHASCTQYEQIEAALRDHLREFPKIAPFRHVNKCLLVVFPDLPARDVGVIKTIHRETRIEFAAAGMMIGSFFPRSKLVSVHDGTSRVFDAPHPFFALRSMSIHDILFMADDPATFDIYNRRYGARFRSNELSRNDRKYREKYFDLLTRFSA